MPVPTSYTEPAFGRYMLSVIDQVGVTLGWDVTDLVVQEAVSDALLDYGDDPIGDITGSTNIRKLRALGQRAIWRAVVHATSDYYSITDNGQRLDRQQVNEQARKSMLLAQELCDTVGATTGWTMGVHAIVRPHDPYSVIEDDQRVMP
jgi:hypothetical protein